MLLTSQLKLFSRLSQTSIRNLAKARTAGRLSQTTNKKTGIFSSLKAPAGDSAIITGRGFVIGASLFGLGALCYYGSGLSSRASISDRMLLWPQYVRDRIHSTYSHFGLAVICTAFSTAFMLRFRAFHNLVMSRPILTFTASLVALIGSGSLVNALPYTDRPGSKHLAWLGHLAIVGAFLSPMVFFLGPQLAVKAGLMTAGVAGSLSLLACYSPNEQFLKYGGTLAVGLGLLIASDVARFFVPMTTVAGSWLTSISLYGGVVLFSMMLLYDTQRVVKMAENPYVKFDPINMSMSIYIDAINLFVRILSIMSGSRKR